MSDLVKILIVDDHESLRDLFEKEFVPENGFEVVGSVPAAALSPDLCRSKAPDIIIMDVCTEGEISGLEATKQIIENYPEIKVIVTSGFDEITYLPRAREIGAHAFVHKSSSLDHFHQTIRRVLKGEYVFPEPKTIPLPQGSKLFSEREMEVLLLLCKQAGNREIADALHISTNTVRRHIENMRQKTGFATTTELVVFVISNGWINPNV